MWHSISTKTISCMTPNTARLFWLAKVEATILIVRRRKSDVINFILPVEYWNFTYYVAINDACSLISLPVRVDFVVFDWFLLLSVCWLSLSACVGDVGRRDSTVVVVVSIVVELSNKTRSACWYRRSNASLDRMWVCLCTRRYFKMQKDAWQIKDRGLQSVYPFISSIMFGYIYGGSDLIVTLKFLEQTPSVSVFTLHFNIGCIYLYISRLYRSAMVMNSSV